MNKNLRRLLLFLFAAYVLGLVFFFGYSFIKLPVLKVGMMRADWIIGNSLGLFVRYLIPLQSAAVVIAYSLFFGSMKFTDTAKGDETLFGHVKRVLVLFLVLTFAYTLLLEGIGPLANRLREQAVKKTAVSNELKSKADRAENEARYSDARYYLEYYLTVNPGDLASKDRLEKIISLEKASGREEKAPPKEKAAEFPPLRMSFDDVLEKARDSLAGEDFIAAEYFAGIAMKLDESRLEPRRIIAESRKKLSGIQFSEDDKRRKDLFDRKRDGYEMLVQKEWVAAYYHFLKLQKEHPSDVEIKKYLRESYDGLKNTAFFREEVALISDLPIFSDLLFQNKKNGAEREFLYFRTLIGSSDPIATRESREMAEARAQSLTARSGLLGRMLRIFGIGSGSSRVADVMSYYAVDIEGIGLTRNGEVLYHFKAPFGKFIDGALVMRCLTRKAPRTEFVPEYIVGDSAGALSSQIEVRYPPEELMRLSRGLDEEEQEGLQSLLALAEMLPVFGMDDLKVRHAFLLRLLLPFSFFILSVISMGIGWKYRGRYLSRPFFLSIVVMGTLPFVTGLVFEIYRYAVSSASSLALMKTGFTAALVLFLAVQGLLVFFSLLFLVRQIAK